MENSPNYNFNTMISSAPSETDVWSWWYVPFTDNNNPTESRYYNVNSNSNFSMGQQHQRQPDTIDIAPSASQDSTNGTRGYGARRSHAEPSIKRQPLGDITKASNKRSFLGDL
jgi:hypothetical protein